MQTPKTIHDLIAVYLPPARREMNEHTYEERQHILEKFDHDCGHITIRNAKPFHLHNFLGEHPEYKSPWSISNVITAVKRAFNWALDMELISRNPFGRVKKPKGKRRRPATEEEFRTLLRGAAPPLRRFIMFLAMSGCRPGEASGMKWAEVRLEDKCVVLQNHKTSRKTGKPRRIPLVPATIKLLLWIRLHKQVSIRQLIESALKNGPMNACELAREMNRFGVTYHAVQRARIALGVVRGRRGKGKKARMTYALPNGHHSAEPFAKDHVFLNSLGSPWNRRSLALAIIRLRKRTGLKKDVSLYSLRHRYGLRAVRHGVNLKLLSLALGHSSTVMSEWYVAEAGLTDEVQAAALQIVYGPGAIAVPAPMAIPRHVPSPEAPPVYQIQAETMHLPVSRHGLGRDRPHVQLDDNKLVRLVLEKLAGVKLETQGV
jgi:integrase